LRFSPKYLKYFLILLFALILADGFRPPESQIVSRGFAGLIGLYQRFLSPIIHLGNHIQMCRFTPTCSEYARQSLLKYGLYKGSAKGTWRLLRCNPWNPGGEDNP
jgi:uncharacterized protein